MMRTLRCARAMFPTIPMRMPVARAQAGDWCGVPVPERYAPPPAGRLTYTGRLRWLVTDPATWRDLLWIAA
ncbi:MAG TPA: sensor domain-containing protein, partial [Streptosporangiaceae bacterium]|nr:sensor domain-containing protein [Streptosporangiaceae bacterium]